MAATDLTEPFVQSVGAVRFASGGDINGYFQTRFQKPFIPWFNQTLAGRDHWKNFHIAEDAAMAARFQNSWDQVIVELGPQFSAMQFVALMSIMMNETGGTLVPTSELFGGFGKYGHPGICYLYDRIDTILTNGQRFRKRSYNNGGSNFTAGRLFKDPAFKAAHGHRPYADKLTDPDNPAWAGDAYPKDRHPTSGDPAEMGYILEADFFKFRGRGLIQTTWRSNYASLIAFIQTYAGNQAVVAEFRDRWRGKPVDTVATESATEDWDRLFRDSDLVIACQAIKAHNLAAGNYLRLGDTAALLNGTSRGSIAFMGQMISGGGAYVTTFRSRVIEICNALGNGTIAGPGTGGIA